MKKNKTLILLLLFTLILSTFFITKGDNIENSGSFFISTSLNTNADTGLTDNIPATPSWGFFNFLVLIGSFALFLYGMKIMSDGLQQAAGSKLRNLLGSITSNPAKGILTGLGITVLIQSSSVTTVMTVSFVNAGILTLTQSVGVVMGANIGTTITAWLVDIFGFKVDIAPYTLIILGIGLPFLFMNSSKTRGWANVVIGFALLFMGLGHLKNAVPELGPESGIVEFFISLYNIPYVNTLIFIFFGTVLTVIIQSSSATVALTMTFIANGIIPFEAGAAMVLGENIGTTITAELAAMVGNVHARRTARINTIFKIIGAIWALLIFPYFIDLVVYLTGLIGSGNPVLNPKSYGSTGLAVFHTMFNMINVLLMVWFIPQLVKLSERMVKSKGDRDEQFQLEYIGSGRNLASSLSILEAKKELAKFGEIAGKMSKFTRELLFENDIKEKKKEEDKEKIKEKDKSSKDKDKDKKEKKNKKDSQYLMKRIKKYEEITDKVEVEIANYLNKISSKSMDRNLAARISGMNRVASNLERIGDLFYQISKIIEKKNEDKICFTSLQKERLSEMFDLIDDAFMVMNKNLIAHYETVKINEASKIEHLINLKRDEMRREYYNLMSESEEGSVEIGLLYNSLYGAMERIGDHIINVTEGIMGRV